MNIPARIASSGHGVVRAAPGDTSGLQKYIENNILGLVILIVGIVVILLARKKNMSDALTVVAILVVGLVVVGLSVNGNGAAFGAWAAHLAFG